MSQHVDFTHADHANEEKRETVVFDAQNCQQCADYLAGWKRAQADYANLKREVERERVEFSKYANSSLIEKLLPALDQFDAALTHAPEALPEPWIAGLRAVKQVWENVFRDIGLMKVPTDGRFDPAIHEAVGEASVEGREGGEIVQVMQDGWKLHAMLLRPARVVLSK